MKASVKKGDWFKDHACFSRKQKGMELRRTDKIRSGYFTKTCSEIVNLARYLAGGKGKRERGEETKCFISAGFLWLGLSDSPWKLEEATGTGCVCLVPGFFQHREL